MSTQLTAEQLETQVKDLKSRILDTQDALHQAQEQSKELIGVLSALAEAMQLTADENGQVHLADLVKAVTEMAKGNTAVEGDAE